MWPFKTSEKTKVVDKKDFNTQRILTLIEGDDIKYTWSEPSDIMETTIVGIKATRDVYLGYRVYVNNIYLTEVDAQRVFSKMASSYNNRENSFKRKIQEEQNNKLRDWGYLV